MGGLRDDYQSPGSYVLAGNTYSARVLAANLTVAGANQTLTIDVPLTNVTGAMTLNGAPLPPTYSDYTGGDFYLIAKDTKVSHYIGGFRYNYQSPGSYVLAS